ncbi:MAG TPA: hypothetical protein ENN61_01515 [Bacteroidaceae bacterium]|nr:hypothetical protein [Bacteroidaceae bacterium]
MASLIMNKDAKAPSLSTVDCPLPTDFPQRLSELSGRIKKSLREKKAERQGFEPWLQVTP